MKKFLLVLIIIVLISIGWYFIEIYIPKEITKRDRAQEAAKHNITKEAAFVIAQKNDFFTDTNIDDALIYFTRSMNSPHDWIWQMVQPLTNDDPDCGTNLIMEINADTGEFIGPQKETWCF